MGGDFGQEPEPCGENICEECDNECDTVDTSSDTGGDADAFTGE